MARTSVMTGGTNAFQTSSEDLNKVRTNFFTDGPVGAVTNTSGVAPMTGVGAVNAQGTPNMTVALSGGDFLVTATPTGQASQRFNVTMDANSAYTIAANSTGSTRYDWIYVKLDPTLLANPDVNGSTVGTWVTSRSTSNTTDNGTPPTYGYNVGVVTVANGAVSITNGNIADKRISSGVTSSTIANGAITPASLVAGAGSSWSWQSWTPTLSNITLGTGGTQTAKYIQIGKTVFVRWYLKLGTSGFSVGSSPTVSLPVAAAADYTLATGIYYPGTMWLSAGGGNYIGVVMMRNTGVVELGTYNVTSTYPTAIANITSTIPGTWGAGDTMTMTFAYEAA